MSTHAWWYLARASGMVAWLLLTLSVTWGVWLSVRQRGSAPRPNWILDLHRWLGGLAVTFTALHLVGMLLDGFVDFRVIDILVPFMSDWHPLAVAWGIIAFYGLISVEVSSLMMKRFDRRTWHRIHLSSYILFWVASLHGLVAGTDTGSLAFAGAAALGMTTVFVGTMRRVRQADRELGRPASRRFRWE